MIKRLTDLTNSDKIRTLKKNSKNFFFWSPCGRS